VSVVVKYTLDSTFGENGDRREEKEREREDGRKEVNGSKKEEWMVATRKSQ